MRGRISLAGSDIEGRFSSVGAPIVSMAPASRIVVGDRTVLVSSPRWTALGVSHPVVLRTLVPGAFVEIGQDVGISGASVCAAIHISIGDRTMVGADAMIIDTDFHALDPHGRRGGPIPDPRPEHAVRIGRDVFIGARAIVTKGASIGDGSVIGAGSVVTQPIPSGCIAAGNPARVISTLDGA